MIEGQMLNPLQYAAFAQHLPEEYMGQGIGRFDPNYAQ